jgi:hypothetical protein
VTSDVTSLHSLDKIISKDTILKDVSKMNPLQKASYDIKYQLFNKSLQSMSSVLKEYEEEMKQGSKQFHSKVLIEITRMFHIFNDLRQRFLISNNVEFFYNEIFLKSPKPSEFTEHQLNEINDTMLKEFLNLIPDSKTFNNHLEYELPSIDEMYEYNELDIYKERLVKSRQDKDVDYDEMPSDELDIKNMHFEYVTLMIDTFNLNSYNPYLRQLIILLICRYNSERAEFIRNLDRTLLFFDENDWKFYSWSQQHVDKFVYISEISSIWLLKIKHLLSSNELEELEEFEINEDIFTLVSILKHFKDAISYDCSIENEGDVLVL